MMQPEKPLPSNPNPNKDEVERLAGEMETEGPPKKGAPKAQDVAPAGPAPKIFTTVPIDKSMAKLKAHRKPRKAKTNNTEVTKNAESQNDAGPGPGSGTPADARKRGDVGGKWTFLPLDWFRDK
jgi:hypothetical protein